MYIVYYVYSQSVWKPMITVIKHVLFYYYTSALNSCPSTPFFLTWTVLDQEGQCTEGLYFARPCVKDKRSDDVGAEAGDCEDERSRWADIKGGG
jgi:hypothetical protein